MGCLQVKIWSKHWPKWKYCNYQFIAHERASDCDSWVAETWRSWTAVKLSSANSWSKTDDTAHIYCLACYFNPTYLNYLDYGFTFSRKSSKVSQREALVGRSFFSTNSQLYHILLGAAGCECVSKRASLGNYRYSHYHRGYETVFDTMQTDIDKVLGPVLQDVGKGA